MTAHLYKLLVIKICLHRERCYIYRYGWPLLSVPSRLHFAIVFYGQVPSSQQASYVTAGRFPYFNPKAELLTNYFDILITCLISSADLQSPSHGQVHFQLLRWFIRDCFFGSPILLSTTLVVWVIDPSSCYCIHLRFALLIPASVPIGCVLLSQRLASPSTVTQANLEHLKVVSVKDFQKQNAKHNTLLGFLSYTMGGNLYLGFQRITENLIINRKYCCCWSSQCQADDGKEQLICVGLPSTVSNPSWGQYSSPQQSLQLKKQLQVQCKVTLWKSTTLRATLKIAWFWLEMWLTTYP